MEILHEQTGALDAPVPRPSTAAIAIVSRAGATVSYRASSVGTTSLVAHHTRLCLGLDPRGGSCAVLKVRIEP